MTEGSGQKHRVVDPPEMEVGGARGGPPEGRDGRPAAARARPGEMVVGTAP